MNLPGEVQEKKEGFFMLKRKLVALALAGTLLTTAMTGCTSKKDDENNSGGTSAENATVDIFQFKVEIAKELENAAKLYMEKNKNVKINIQTVGGGDDYGAALRAKMQSGAEPAIFNIGGPQDVEDWASKLDDLSDQPWIANANQGTLPAVQKDGKTYGMPFAIEGYGFIYNKEILSAAGIDGSTIKTYDALVDAVKKLDTKIKDGSLKKQYPNLKAVFELPAKETWVTGNHTANVVLSQELNDAMAAYNAKTIDFKYASQFKDLIDLQAKYTENGSNWGKLNSIDYATQVGQGIAVERVAMIQQGNWIYNDVKQVDPTVADNLDIMPIPVKGGKEDSIPVGVPMYWCVNKNAKDADKKAAKDFLNWLYTSDEGKDYIVNKFYFVPPFNNFGDVKPQDPLGRTVKAYADAGKTLPWVFNSAPVGWTQDVLGSSIQKYLGGQATWDKIISDAKSKWQEMRSK